MGRFSLRVLFCLLLIVALSCAGIRYLPRLWSTTALLAAVLVLLASVLGVVFRHGTARAFWTGFALFGWSYLILATGPWTAVHLGPFLGTTTLLIELYTWLYRQGIVAASGLTLPDVYRGGHALLSLLLAYFGGLVACYFAAGSEPRLPARHTPALGADDDIVSAAEAVIAVED